MVSKGLKSGAFPGVTTPDSGAGSTQSSRCPPTLKSRYLAWFLVLLLGWTGAHRFYLGRPTSGLVLCLVTLLPLTLLFMPVTETTGYVDAVMEAIAGGWVLYDITRISKWLRAYDPISQEIPLPVASPAAGYPDSSLAKFSPSKR